ncbi:MAG: hypothetical protein JG777_2146 [Clostridia bacterium]|jgi:hypothetical protein|nr:hypothetical protein [Clostridia bacterium]
MSGNYKFRAHESFFIRKGWLYKGLKNVNKKPNVFTDKNENPMDILGIGANMVKSLRYWLQAVCLTEEPKYGVKEQTFTKFGQIIWENDTYIEEMGTLWLLHYKLASNEENATAWYYFFNEFRLTEFKKDDFVLSISNYVKMRYGHDLAISSFEGDFDCIVNTYISRMKSTPEKVHPESNINCPFGELGLIDIVNRKEKIYKKSAPKKDTLHPLVVLAVILDQAKGQNEIKITSMLNDACNVGKVFNLDIIGLTSYLYKIQQIGHIKVIRTAGLDIVRITTKMDFYECVREYYKEIDR